MSGDERELFHMTLPEECISFYSDEGKVIFAEALATGHMNCYFKLAAQFRTQDEPAHCGVSTLVMILNALVVDPGVTWKGPWRWYHESMLNCSTPCSNEKSRPISMEQFASVADCNSLDAFVEYTDLNSEDHFRQIIKEYSRCDDSFVVVSFLRASLQQIGDADFVAIGGYHPTKDVVLLLDTARYKYPPHWIWLPSLYHAMNTRDEFTDHSRGYILLRKKSSPSLLLFRTSHILKADQSEIEPDVLSFLRQWTSYLCDEMDRMQEVFTIENTIDKFVSLATKLEPKHMLVGIDDVETPCGRKNPEEYGQKLLQQIEKTQVFAGIQQKIKLHNVENSHRRRGNENNRRISEMFRQEKNSFSKEHILTLLLLSWPFCCSFEGRKEEVCVGRILQNFIKNQFLVLRDPLATEVVGLSHQLSVRLHLINFRI